MNTISTQSEQKPHVYSVWFERRDREGIAAAMNSFAERPAVVHAFVQAQLTYELLQAIEAQNQKLQQLIDLTTASDKANREWREEGRAGLEYFQQTLNSLNLSASQDKPDVPDFVLPEVPEDLNDWLPPVEGLEESTVEGPAADGEPASTAPAASVEPATSNEPTSTATASSVEPASSIPDPLVEVDPTAATTAVPTVDALFGAVAAGIRDWRPTDAG